MTKEKADNLADSIRQCIRVSLNTRSFGHTGLISLNECQEIENQAFALLSERIQLAFELEKVHKHEQKDCPKCGGRGLLPIHGQRIPCDHITQSRPGDTK